MALSNVVVGEFPASSYSKSITMHPSLSRKPLPWHYRPWVLLDHKY